MISICITDLPLSFTFQSCLCLCLKCVSRDAWVAQSVKNPASAQVMVSQFVSSSTTSGSALTVWSLLEILSLSPSLSVPPPLMLSIKINKGRLGGLVG